MKITYGFKMYDYFAFQINIIRKGGKRETNHSSSLHLKTLSKITKLGYEKKWNENK